MKLFKFLSLFAIAISVATVNAGEYRREVKQLNLRGYGTVSMIGESDGKISLSQFICESPDKARIVSSKYLADLLAFGPVKKNSDGVLEIRHGGWWKLGLQGNKVMILSVPDQDSFEEAFRKYDANKWESVPEHAYPAYLDNFDNAALAIRCWPQSRTEEQIEYIKRNPFVLTIHHQDMGCSYAPGILDNAGPRNSIKQAKEAGKSFRNLLWTSTGKDTWYSWLNLPTTEYEASIPGFLGLNYREENGYYSTQVASEWLDRMQMAALEQLMNNWKDDTSLLGWMEPHGEFRLFTDRRPPDAEKGYREYLREIKKYDLNSLSAAWEISIDNWNKIPFPEPAFFEGRRGNYIDLDNIPWKWYNDTFANGQKSAFMADNFDDAGWTSAMRTDKRLLAYTFNKDVPAAAKEKNSSLWTRFNYDIPAEFLKSGSPIILHMHPYSSGPKEFQNLSIWVNGQKAGGELRDKNLPQCNEHSEIDVTEYLKSGQNSFTIHHAGGRISYRVYLSQIKGESFPYSQRGLNQQYLDWIDYLRHGKFQTLKKYLSAMRAIDPVRPIRVMTPKQWQSDALDLFEQFGAYPQLTGEGGYYRPYNYSGYTTLRNRYSSSEPGGFAKDAFSSQRLFAYILWESQMNHDYVFDFNRDFWKYPEVVKWWEDHKALLQTVGKTDFISNGLGVLRDLDQDQRYANRLIWNWDLSRGALPALGLAPVLIDGQDLIKGYANGRVKVMIDCATAVMDDKLLKALKSFVSQGGIFIAQHHTGQHTPEKRDAWPLAKALGLKINSVDGIKPIHFTETQDLFPSLKGKKLSGRGMAIDHYGTSSSGQIAIKGEAKAVALWDDNSMAIAELPYGKGKFIILGSPFYVGIRDENGSWMNEDQRSLLLKELLVSCGIEATTNSSNSQVWFEKRASKNGLYDVYMAGAIGLRGKEKLSLTDKLNSTLSAQQVSSPAVEVSEEAMPDLKVKFKDGIADFGKLEFTPFQVREFAVIRDHAGVDGPAHWLQTQEHGWYRLTGKPEYDRAKTQAVTQEFTNRIKEAAIDLSTGWHIKLDSPGSDWQKAPFQSWPIANMGSWYEQGFPAATSLVHYRKQVQVPSNWLDSKSRIYLEFNGHFVSGGVQGPCKLYLNGQNMLSKPSRRFRVLIPEKDLKRGTLDLAFEVGANKSNQNYSGPVGAMFLRKIPVPTEVIELNGEWTECKSLLNESGNISIPFKGKIFGISREFEIPQSWQGKIIRLVIEENNSNNMNSELNTSIINTTGYFRENSFLSPGIRMDRYLIPGKRNRLAIYKDLTRGAIDTKPININIQNIKLEAY